MPAASQAQVLAYPDVQRGAERQAEALLRVSPAQFDVVLDRGTSTQRTLTIENTDADQAHAFELAIRSMPAGAAATKRGDVLAGTYVYASDVFGFEATGDPRPAPLLRFNLDRPGELEAGANLPVSYAGDFAFGDARRLYLITHQDQTFQVLDVDTGQRTTLGTAQPLQVNEYWADLATDPTDGTLYALTVDQYGWSHLYEIDPAIGKAQWVARIQDARYVVALAVSDTGQLYGYSLNSAGNVLLEINKYTGTARPVGSTSFRASGLYQSMDFDPLTGTLYLAVSNLQPARPELYAVNPQTGEASLRAAFSAHKFGFLAMPSRSFVEPSVVEGTVPPGGRVDLEVTFDAAYMLAGVYHAAIRITTPDAQPDVEVPVRLHVRGQALIDVRQSALNFGPVMIGGERSLPLPLHNVGSDTLRVTGIASDEAVFALSPGARSRLPLVLPPGLGGALTVAFRPDATGPFAGNLIIESNDPVQPFLPVSMSGEGRDAPRLSFSPEVLDVQVVQGGATEHTLTLANTGPAVLTYDFKLDADGFGDAIEPPVLVESFDAGIPSTWTVIDHAGQGLVWQAHTTLPSVDNWTNGDGPAAMVSSNTKRFTPFDTELRTPEQVAPSSRLELRFRANYANKGEGEDYFDVDVSTDGGASWITLRRFDENLGSIFAGPGTGVSVDLSPYLKRGDSFLIRWRYHDATAQPDDWYVQIDNVEIAVKTKVLKLSSGSGTVPPQSTEEVQLVFDAEGLVPGSYDATLQLTTNDPLAAERTIPLALSVVGGVQATLPAVTVRPHQSVEVPLYVQGQVALETFAFTLVFDPALLDLLTMRTTGTLAEDVALDVDTSTPGRLTVATRAPFATPVDLNGSGLPPLVVLRFQARDVVRASDLTLTSLLLNGITPPGTITSGRLSVEPVLGDVTLDGAVNGKDMYRLSQHLLGVDPLFRASRVAADVSGDGEVTLVDASLLRRFMNGDLSCFPADSTCAVAGKLGTDSEALQTSDFLEAGVPEAFALEANYPNPFNPATTISYALPEAADVTLTVYNLLGQPVRTLVNSHQSAGRYTVEWNGRSDAGTSVASGTYLYRLRAGSFVAVQRMTLVK